MVDYATGVEVGLGSNGRKNRGQSLLGATYIDVNSNSIRYNEVLLMVEKKTTTKKTTKKTVK